MDLDDHVCLCHGVSLRKLIAFMKRRKPAVPSQLSECLNAGCSCHWCVPFLEQIHRQWKRGQEPMLEVSPEEYAHRRNNYHRTGKRQSKGAS